MCVRQTVLSLQLLLKKHDSLTSHGGKSLPSTSVHRKFTDRNLYPRHPDTSIDRLSASPFVELNSADRIGVVVQGLWAHNLLKVMSAVCS